MSEVRDVVLVDGRWTACGVCTCGLKIWHTYTVLMVDSVPEIHCPSCSWENDPKMPSLLARINDQVAQLLTMRIVMES